MPGDNTEILNHFGPENKSNRESAQVKVKNMILFLDFDGVLRRLTSDPSRFDKDCLDCFELSIRQYPEVKIVISSTWRLAMSLTAIRNRFSSDVAGRIVGVTPETPINSLHSRYKEICAYLKKPGVEVKRWIAIDDDPELYPKEAPVLLTDPNNGFDHICADKLKRLILIGNRIK